jgi:hypothetical protein
MPEKNPDAARYGGPGSAHQDRKHPEKDVHGAADQRQSTNPTVSKVSGGGGERDSHHTHDPRVKG